VIIPQADDKKVKKTKKKKEDEAPAAEAAPAAAEPAAEAPKRASTRESKKAKRSGSNVFSMFSQRQVAEFKEVRKSCIQRLLSKKTAQKTLLETVHYFRRNFLITFH